jgi:hypothetical protein
MPVMERPSPELEAMVAEAEALRAKPALEMPPAEKALEMPQAFQMPGQMPGRMPSELRMPSAVQMPQQMGMKQLSMAEEAVAMPARAMVRMPEEQRLKMTADTELLFREITRTQIPPQRRRVYHRPTVRLERPVFAIVTHYELDADNKVDLVADLEFTPDETQAAVAASEYFNANIESVVESINYDYRNEIETKTRDGKTLHATIPDEDVWDIVSTVAYRNAADSDWTGGAATVHVFWKDEEGNNVFSEQRTYDEIIEDWGLEPEDFEVLILRLTEGHDSSLGRTTQDTFGTKGAYETWTTSGRYLTESAGRYQVGYSVPIEMRDLIPDVEDVEFGDHAE